MQRFFVNPEEIQGQEVVFAPARSRQIARVLRLKNGQNCMVLDNRGGELLVELTQVEAGACRAVIVERAEAQQERIDLLMLLSLTQREKFEWMLQKCTEVGVSTFQPVITSRSLVQQPVQTIAKYERWKTIIWEAAEQSARSRLPELLPPAGLAEAVAEAARRCQRCLIPWEGEKARTLKGALAGPAVGSVALFIGPEGGFAEGEVQQAVNASFNVVTLGRRILRMETAAVVSAALVLHELESTEADDGGTGSSGPIG